MILQIRLPNRYTAIHLRAAVNLISKKAKEVWDDEKQRSTFARR